MRMKLLVEWDDDSLVLEPGKTYVLGRDASSDIPIYFDRISRSHLRFSFENNNWVIKDLDSSNGSFIGNKKFEVHQVTKAVVIDLGGTGNFSLKVVPLEGSATQSTKAQPIDREATRLSKVTGGNYQKDSSELARVRLQQRIRIGRNSESEWHIDDLNVSRNHAEIVQSSSGNYEIVDLKSTNGTFLNGARVKREILKTGDIISIGGFARRFTLDGLQILEGIDGMSVSAREIYFNIGKKPLLQDVSFNLGPRTLTAIVGPSGAGKSTLLGVLTGRTKPSQGQIIIGGVDLHTQFQSLSRQIGSVPQADILHTRLTVRQALNYGAKLRLPNDTTKAERNSRVEDVMAQLELTERADLRIDRLSGGQRKRASIGLELLTSPQLLVLDEPTSGLDPGLDAHVMETLRKLADNGQTVVLVTHSVDNLDFCDNVILLASGGKVAYAGPSSTVFSKLGKKSWAEVFRFLATPDALLLATPKHEDSISTEIKDHHVLARKQGIFKQIFTLSQRYLRVIASDRFYLALLTLIPVVIGAIAYAAGSKYGFGSGTVTRTGFDYNPFAQATILVLILGSIFVGLSTGVQEIVKENAIRKREQSVGIRASSYVVSKVLVLGLIVVLQIVVFTSIVLFNRPMPESGLLFSSSKLEVTSICVALGISSMLLGLLISAFLSSSEQAMPTLVGMTMIQVVLSGALPLEAKGIINQISMLVPSYWANNALSASVDIVQLNLTSDPDLQVRWASVVETLTTSMAWVGAFSLFFVLTTFLRVQRSR
jgi:ABC-type multidrug transport system ATPase subunit/pSer/pThr/pTyr-binding forkhead associated (FHA) protein